MKRRIMSDRRCPYCNEFVPSNSLTCPACYKQIPRDIERTKTEKTNEAPKENGDRAKSGKSRTIAIGLAIIPGVFGIMGLGQIYLGSFRKGLVFLVLGLPLMLLSAFLVSSIGGISTGWAVIAIGSLLLVGIPYVLLFIFQLLDAMASSIFRQ